MAERSKLPFEHHPGCMESLFHFFDLQHHLRLPKMIGYKKPGLKISKIKQNISCTGEDVCFINKDSSNSSIEKTNSGSPTKSPTKSPRIIPTKSFKSSKSKKNLRDNNNKGHKRSISSLSPIASRLMRTMSIHHLSNFNYTPNVENNSENNSSIKCQECGNVSPLHNGKDQVPESNDLNEFLSLFHANKDVFMKIVHNPYVLLEKESNKGENISSISNDKNKLGLNNSKTFPRPGLTRTEEHFKPFKSNMKKVINQKEVTRITNDGLLHKVPYGAKEIEWQKSNNYNKEVTNNQTKMRRSNSLNESLDKYSNLLESISKPEVKPKPNDLSLKRIHSLPEMRCCLHLPPTSPSLTTINDDESLLSYQIESVNSELEDETCASSPLSCFDIKQEQIDPIESELDFSTSDYNIQVDETDESYFYFIKDILIRSGLTVSDQPILDPLFIEPESDSDPDQLLMSDLINEVLLDIYDSNSLLKSLPSGEKMIKEVWIRFKKYLNLVVEVKVEDVVKNDFLKKNDTWMGLNLNFESECVGFDLEDWILEDLIDEILFE